MKHLHERDAVATAELSEFAGRLKHFRDERQARCSSAGSLFFSHFKGLVPPPPHRTLQGDFVRHPRWLWQSACLITAGRCSSGADCFMWRTWCAGFHRLGVGERPISENNECCCLQGPHVLFREPQKHLFCCSISMMHWPAHADCPFPSNCFCTDSKSLQRVCVGLWVCLCVCVRVLVCLCVCTRVPACASELRPSSFYGLSLCHNIHLLYILSISLVTLVYHLLRV